ncbi:MAG TPA: tetratricopeptide repeat protein, partial [Sphingomonas sp.]|nr:tetratricopeptide repeat protein [Sphingomonas sp.]
THPAPAPPQASEKPAATALDGAMSKSRELAVSTFSAPAIAPPAPAAPPVAKAAAEAAPLPAAQALADSQTVRGSSGRMARNAGVDSESKTDSNIVVTGTRANRDRRSSRRGDWNACTVNDPQQTLRGCNSQLNSRLKGTAGEAAARLSEGLSAAWQGEWDEAIRAFDKAIALKPKFAFAFLNRGLAYQRNGDLERAAADFDLAVKYEPSEPRNYYSRGMARRLLGDKRGADRDLATAVSLDADYRDMIE